MIYSAERIRDNIEAYNDFARQRTRRFEWGMIHAYKNHDTVIQETTSLLEAACAVPLDKVIDFNGPSRFQRDVQAIVGLLEFDGTLAVKVEKQPTVFYRKAHRIAAELQERGLCWVKVQHVEAAQQLKAHKAA